jgi:hypothetical protein
MKRPDRVDLDYGFSRDVFKRKDECGWKGGDSSDLDVPRMEFRTNEGAVMTLNKSSR